MTEIIRGRINQLQQGIIPEGYHKTKAGIMPDDWDDIVKAKHIFKSHTDKKHNGDLEILAATQENGIVPRSQIGIDIQCSEEGISGYKKVSKGDFVISLRSFQGGIEYSEYDGIVSPAYTVLKPKKSICGGYFRNYFKTNAFIQRLSGAVYGIRDGKQIGYEDFGNLHIHYPPLAEQKKIAKILAQCDKVIALKKERLEEERKKKKWLMSCFFKAGTYPRVQLGKICTLVSGQDLSEEHYNTVNMGVPYLTGATNIVDGEIVLNRWTKDAIKVTKNGDILIVCKGSGIGKMAIYYGEDAHIARQFMAVRVPKESRMYIYYAIQQGMNEIKQLSKGLIEGLDRKSILEFQLELPPTNVQVEHTKVLITCDNLIQKLEDDLWQWTQKKKALMQLLLTGIVRVNI